MRIPKIVEIINESLNTSLKSEKFIGGKLYGISQLCLNGENTIPATVRSDGECVWLDQYADLPLQVYHRTIAAGPEQQTKNQYGRVVNDEIKRSWQMTMIASGNRTKLLIAPEDTEAILTNAFPSSLTVKQKTDFTLNNCNVSITASLFDTLGIFKREYQYKNIAPLLPEVFLFEV